MKSSEQLVRHGLQACAVATMSSLSAPVASFGWNPLRQPFHRESIWNMPIGGGSSPGVPLAEPLDEAAPDEPAESHARDDPVYLARLDNSLNAFAARYDGKPRRGT
jgi:hypothetical protein